jgi:hypothetical protein
MRVSASKDFSDNDVDVVVNVSDFPERAKKESGEFHELSFQGRIYHF